MPKLFEAGRIGPYHLSHRVVFAPMTRLRSDRLDTPLPMMAEHYGQRASPGGFLIAESAAISISSRSYYGAPGIYISEHVAGWKKVTDAVHAKAARIFLQVFHGGRQSHRDITGGTMPIGPSVVPFKGMAKTEAGFTDSGPFRAIGIEEIPGVLADFRRAAIMALESGFDGVSERLSGLGLAYLHVIDPRIKGDSTLHEGRGAVAAAFMREHYTGTIIAAGGFDRVQAIDIVERGDADYVSFARWFSSNPDLPDRLRHDWPLTPYNRDAFWGGDEHGYTDFLPYQPVAASAGHDEAAATICSADCVQCGLRGPDHAMPCIQPEGSRACLVS